MKKLIAILIALGLSFSGVGCAIGKKAPVEEATEATVAYDKSIDLGEYIILGKYKNEPIVWCCVI